MTVAHAYEVNRMSKGGLLGCTTAKLVIVAMAFGCGGESANDADVGEAPTDPDPPVLTPCPAGWREVPPSAAHEVTTCDPWPATGPDECPEGEVHFPGEPGCEPIGSECPSGEWPDDLPSDGSVLYVRSGGESGGLGSREAPFGRIAEAVAAAQQGTIIALSTGRFDEVVELPGGVALQGACVSGTTVAATAEWIPPESPGDATGTILVEGPDAAIRDLTVTGTRIGVVVRPEGNVDLEGLLVDRAVLIGVVLVGGQARARSVVVRNTAVFPRDDPTVGLGGGGLVAVSGAHLELSRAVVDGNVQAGLVVVGVGTAATLSDVAVRTSELAHIPILDGIGLVVLEGADVSVDHAIFEDNPGQAVSVLSIRSGDDMTPTALDLSDVVIRGRDEPTDNVIPAGLWAQGDSGPLQLTVERTLVERARLVGIYANHSVTLAATDVVVQDTRSSGAAPTPDTGGIGVWIRPGARAELTRLWLLRNAGVGLWVEAGAVAESQPPPGFFPVAWPQLALTSSVTGAHVAVVGTDPMGCGQTSCPGNPLGLGIAVIDGARCELTRFLIDTSALAGLQLARGGEADLSDGQVSENLIGVNLQTPDFDLSRLQDNVLFIDNGRNLDSLELPVPNPGDFLPDEAVNP